MGKLVKIAVSIPDKDFKKLEKMRKEKGISRSRLFVEAFRLLQETSDHKKDIRKYAEGYRKFPEDTRELEAWEKAAISVFSPDDW
jgi:metal-responsive CopG/Arc/MetJ family transcriptional regulator